MAVLPDITMSFESAPLADDDAMLPRPYTHRIVTIPSGHRLTVTA